MRKRDWVFIGIAALGVVGYLVWALTTQLRWARSNKPIQAPESVREDETPKGRHATEVVGPITDETRAALERNLEAQKKAREKHQKN